MVGSNPQRLIRILSTTTALVLYFVLLFAARALNQAEAANIPSSDSHTVKLLVDTTLAPPALDAESNYTIYITTLHAIANESGEIIDADELCLDEVRLYDFISLTGSFSVSDFETEDLPLCTPMTRRAPMFQQDPGRAYTSIPEEQRPKGYSLVRVGTEEDAPILGPDPDQFMYPYDSFASTFRVWVRYRMLKAKTVVQSESGFPKMNINMAGEHANWTVDGTVVNLDFSRTMQDIPLEITDEDFRPGAFPATAVVLKFERPFFERMIITSVIGVILLFILLLVFVDSLGTFIKGGAAVFFGIFGLKQVLLPVSTGQRTIIDYAIAALYLVFAVVAVPHMWRHFSRILVTDKVGTRDFQHASDDDDEEKALASGRSKAQGGKASRSGKKSSQSNKTDYRKSRSQSRSIWSIIRRMFDTKPRRKP